MRLKYFGFLCLGMISQISAQTGESEISEVFIHGKFLDLPVTKVSENITVINREEIRSSPATSVEEVLAQITGFDIRRRGGNGVQADISLRGSSFEQVLILVNGVRMNDSQTGHNSMSVPFDLASVERIEVIKGPAARRFGQNAYAGVINIVTKPAAEDTTTVSASGGDFGTYSLGLGTHMSTEKVAHFVQLNSSSSEGYRYNTDYKINNIFYQNQFRVASANVRFQAGIQEKKFGANGFYATAAATDQYEETQASVVSLSADRKWDSWTFNSNIYWRRGQDIYEYVRGRPELYRNIHIGNNIGGEINTTLNSALGRTGLGVEIRKEFLASNNLGRRERFITQLFLEHHFSFFDDRMDIAPGISWSAYDREGNFLYPGVDVGYNLSPNHKIYGNAAKVSRIPTFTDLYYLSKTEAGNPFLQPEHAFSAEVGYRYHRNGLELKASGFLRDTDNSIDWVKASENELWRAENIGSIYTQGIELELRQQLNSFVQSWSLGYTFLDSRAEKLENLWSRYIMENLKHQVVAKMENKLYKELTAQWVYRYNERVTTGSYHLLDLKLNWQYNDLQLFLLINNLTSTRYTETFGVPMPGRWFQLGFNYRIGL
ncbi:TonB-dependent receptor [Marnyiella aurantia]|uniref:TonB-dependent receptor n=1 Tax=Marnyiella aurantia TaxID=2758037 RepID=A0A7D7QT00_9FLAO|nr:TonB-dependent receptor [Marnyiella aurantia]MBA5245851.1 TonB-dependent receptor [Marnyiella aurantia]QMS98748.1 TonB-dependent receptor [Marnyiella aurantia]